MKLNLFKLKKRQPVEVDHERVVLSETRLSAANINEVNRKYAEKFRGKSCVVVVCQELRFIDSSGLGFLVGMRNSMLAPKQVILEGIEDPTLVELLSLTRLDQVFQLSKSLTESQRLKQG